MTDVLSGFDPEGDPTVDPQQDQLIRQSEWWSDRPFVDVLLLTVCC
jgi:hypothetical protein